MDYSERLYSQPWYNEEPGDDPREPVPDMSAAEYVEDEPEEF